MIFLVKCNVQMVQLENVRNKKPGLLFKISSVCFLYETRVCFYSCPSFNKFSGIKPRYQDERRIFTVTRGKPPTGGAVENAFS